VRAGEVEVDACVGGCGGLWFDTRELRKVDEAAEQAGEALLHVAQGTTNTSRSERRHCTRCPKPLPFMTRRFHPALAVQIDECPGCGGHWLDAGELAAIRQLAGDAAGRRRAAADALHTQVLPTLAREKVAQDNAREYSLGGLLRWLGAN
jgi:hypothetical protein